MKVTKEKEESRQVFLTIEMEPDEVEESLEGAYQRLVKKTNIPGFRKGKAPRVILEQYVGKERLFEDALNSLVPDAFRKAIKEQEIKPFAPPDIEITQTEPVVLKAKIPLPPEIDLNDYQSIRANPESAEVKESDIDAAMEGLRHQYATWEPAERPVNYGDLVVVDVDSKVEGLPFINKLGVQYLVAKDSVAPAPGFAEQLLGMETGGTKEFTLKLPSDYRKEELAGKEVNFKVKVNEIKQEKLPELNDEFVKQVSQEMTNLGELRERVTSGLKENAEERVKRDFEQKVVTLLVDRAKIEYPPMLVDAEIDRLINEQMRQWQMDRTGLEEYLKRSNKTMEQLREDLRPVAIKRVVSSLVLDKVAEVEKIEVTEPEIDAETEIMLQNTDEANKDKMSEFLSTPDARQSIRDMVVTRKTIKRLLEIASVSTESDKATKKEETND